MGRNFFFACLLVSTGLFAQQSGAVKGIILDQEMNSQPLQMANIELKGTSHYTQSNFFGDFQIENVEPGDYEMIISFAGYETIKMPLRIKADETTEIQLSLVAMTLGFDEFYELTESNETTASVHESIAKSNED